MKFVLIIALIVLALIAYFAYYYIYPELVFKSTWKKIAGEEYIGLNCWGYNFVEYNSNHTLNKYYSGKEFKTSEKVILLRDLLNQGYYNYTNFGIVIGPVCYYNNTRYEYTLCPPAEIKKSVIFENGSIDTIRYQQILDQSVEKIELTNVTIPEYYVIDLITSSVSTNFVESIYSIMEDTVPEERPTTCGFVKPVEEEVSKVLLIAVTTTETGSLAYTYASMTKNNTDYCINQTDNKTCIYNFLKKLETMAEEKKASLTAYTKVNMPKCPNTQVYLDIKDLEKTTREQLDNAKEPFSIIWKTILINSYDLCSKKLDKDCPLIPQNKNRAVANIMANMGVFVNCSINHIKGELDMLANQLAA